MVSGQGAFNELCAELNASLTPALLAYGFVSPGVPFSRKELKYEFKRPGPSGLQTLAVLFGSSRRPNFTIQVYVEPVDGWASLRERGGMAAIGLLVRKRRFWPFSPEHFGLQRSGLSRLLEKDSASVAHAVQEAIVLLPEVEDWWHQHRGLRHIVSATVKY